MIQRIFHLIPESELKNRIRCIYYNNFDKKINFKVNYKNGIFYVIFNDGLELKFLENPHPDLSVPVYGYEMKRKLQKGDIVVDAGAYAGVFSIYAAKRIGENGKVIAFEPDPDNYKKLLDNIKLNGVDNIIPVQKGLWNKDGEMKFSNELGECSSLIGDNKNGIVVDVASLDNELKRLGIKKVDFIKMDIEGAEIEALKGMNMTLKWHPYIAIASYHIIDGKTTSFEVERMLKGMRYESESGYGIHLTTYGWK